MRAIANRFLTCLGIHLLFLELLVSAAKKPRDYSPAIYYGDSDVKIGDPFSITCIISISDPIEWLKDGETITKHNLRHGKDVHAYFQSEHAIEGESDKIEARLNVKHALQIHEGKYQCNSLHSSYHYLRVHKENNKYGTESIIDSPSTIYSFRPPPPPPQQQQPPSIFVPSFQPPLLLPTDVNITSTATASTTTRSRVNNLYNTIDQQQRQKPHHRQRPYSNIDNQVPEIYFQQEFTTSDNVMRNTGGVGGGNIHNIHQQQHHHHHKTTDFYLDNTETEVTSVEEIGMSLKPFITSTSLPPRKQFENEYHHLEANIYSKMPSQQQQPSSISSTPVFTKQQQQLPSTPSIMTSTHMINNNKQDGLVSVTSSVSNDINRKDTSSPQENKSNSSNSIPLIIYTINKNLTIPCDIPNASSISWLVNGTDISENKLIKDKYKLKENKFTLDKAGLYDHGIYTCIAKVNDVAVRKEFKAAAQVEVRVPSNLGVVEGETLKIQCTVVGTDPYLMWEREKVPIDHDFERYHLKMDEERGIPNAVLEIVNVSLEDRGEYKCIGRNEGAPDYARNASDVSMVRVKGKLAALWPFLGICAEVFVLCAIILIYEKKRNKTDLDESDTDPNTEQKKKRRNYD